MKRDMELVREILLEIRERTDLKRQILTIEGRDTLAVQRHIEMLYDADYIEGLEKKNMQTAEPCADIFIKDMSWSGHEFLAALENEDVWGKIKSTFSTTELAGMPLSVLKDIGVDLLKEWAKGKLGITGT